MSASISLSRASLAVTILLSTIGSFIACSPPNPSVHSVPVTGDIIRWLRLADKHTTKIALAPIGLLSLHASSLAYVYPNVPPSILRYGAENGVNADLLTWSAATFVPLVLILGVGVPLRLVSYASLGKNFTFALAEPDRLTTTGVYRYVQHPSYTGLVALLVGNLALLCRVDGALGCWVPPPWYGLIRNLLEKVLVPLGFSVLIFVMWMRVRQEELMLQAKFGIAWKSWHARTARFIPWVL